MPYDEFVGWFAYFERRPPGWREDHRAYITISSNGVKINATKVFPSLINVYKDSKKIVNAASTLKNSAFFSKMLNAVGGDILPGLKDGDNC